MSLEGFEVPNLRKNEVLPFSTDSVIADFLEEIVGTPYEQLSPELRNIADQIVAYKTAQNRPETTLQ